MSATVELFNAVCFTNYSFGYVLDETINQPKHQEGFSFIFVISSAFGNDVPRAINNNTINVNNIVAQQIQLLHYFDTTFSNKHRKHNITSVTEILL